MKRKIRVLAVLALGICLAAAGCYRQSTQDRSAEETPSPNMAEARSPQLEQTLIRAVADLRPTEGSNVRGTVTFTQQPEGVMITADIMGLSPGQHGFHIHEFGDCSAPDASSAGGHYNPTNQQHGGPTDQARHIGDMGNVEADTTGMAHMEYLDRLIELDGPNSVIGKSVVVHEKQDDLQTQPTGDSGGRLACGVITADRSVEGAR